MLLKKLDIVLLKKKHTAKIESIMGRFMSASTTYEQNGARISNWTWYEKMEIYQQPSAMKVTNEDIFFMQKFLFDIS